MDPAIVVQSLGKKFRRYNPNRPRTIMAAALAGWRGVKARDYFWALRDISFTVAPGETLGVIGRNGAGKSTLLRLLGRVGRSEEGKIILNGRVGALLDLGAGFHPDLTGRENVLVNGVVAGLLEREARQRFDSIVEFAELANFIESPVRTYSSGMMMRLAFSVAVHTYPEILLVDEYLSVGDQSFQNKCLDRIEKMKAEGCAVVFVSHSVEQIAKLCDRAICLNQGRIWAEGKAAVVVEKYRSTSFNLEERQPDFRTQNSDVRLIDQAPEPYPAGQQKNAGNKLPILKINHLSIPGLSVYENVISYPLIEGKSARHSGGLIHPETLELIDEAILWGGNVPFQELPDLDQNSIRQYPYCSEKTLFYGGILYDHFGHFLLESLSRLWAYHLLDTTNLSIGFYAPWKIPNYLDSDHFVNQALRGLAIPLDKIVVLNHPVKLKEVIVPYQKYGYEYLFEADDMFMNFIKSFNFIADLPEVFENADKIYVSRSQMSLSSGRPIAEDQFEEYLQLNGYKIFHPQNHSLYQQLTILRNARQVIFCDGSALHSCILLPDLKSEVAVVARRKKGYSGNCRTIIEQFQGYGKDIHWIDAVGDQYQFGMETWEALAWVDWHKVSQELKQFGFVDTIFSTPLDPSFLINQELQEYICEIANKPQFIQFMLNHKEVSCE